MPLKVITGRSNTDLSIKIIECLVREKVIDGKANVIINTFANTEINVKIEESVRGDDVYIINTGSSFQNRATIGSINDVLWETFELIDGCRRSSATSITVILPCYPYARSDKKDHRGPISAKLVTDMLISAGATRIVSLDLHSGQIQAFSNKPFDNLYAIRDISKYLVNTIFPKYGKSNYVLVSPDAGGIKRIKAYSELLHMNHVILNKQRDYTTNNKVDKSVLIGDPEWIKDKVAIVIDDMIDTAGTMIKGAEELMRYGAKEVILVATHGILSNPATEKINATPYISDVIVTNSIDQTTNYKEIDKLHVIDVSELITTVIKCLKDGSSISDLFEKSHIEQHMAEYGSCEPQISVF